MNEIVKEGN